MDGDNTMGDDEDITSNVSGGNKDAAMWGKEKERGAKKKSVNRERDPKL